MPSIYILPPLGASLDADGVVRLSDGRSFNLSSVPGNGYNANRLGRINKAIRDFVDVRILRAALPPGDPDATVNPGLPNLFWSNIDGDPDPAGLYLCARPVLITLSFSTGALIPKVVEVR